MNHINEEEDVYGERRHTLWEEPYHVPFKKEKESSFEEDVQYVDDFQGQIINTTKNDIIVVNDSGEPVLYPRAHGKDIARIEIEHETAFFVNGIEVVQSKKIKSKSNIPPRLPNVWYIVTSMVAEVFPERTDFLVAFRNEKNTIRTASGELRYSTALKIYRGDADEIEV